MEKGIDTIVAWVGSRDEKILNYAVKLLKKGEPIVFPTDTVYGLGVNAINEEAVEKIYEVKKRPRNKWLPIGVLNMEMAEKYSYLTETAKTLFRRFQPGPLTIIVKKKKNVPDVVNPSNIALRVPNHWVPLFLIKKTKTPLIITSANITGQPPPTDAYSAFKMLKGEVSLILDGGETKIKKPSTVVDLTKGEIKVIREGIIKKEDILKVLNKEDAE